MVFGFSRKERRVPDLSRYDYYYQNHPDYNKSHRLSAAAASAASGMSRSQSMIYSSPHTQSYFNRNSTISQSTGSNPHVLKKSNSQYLSPNRNSSYKTYSLRSQSSVENLRTQRQSQQPHQRSLPRTRISSTPINSTYNNNSNSSGKIKTKRYSSVGETADMNNKSTTTRKTTIPSKKSTRPISNTVGITPLHSTKKTTTHNNTNIRSTSLSTKAKRINSLTSNTQSHSQPNGNNNNNNNSRLNSMTSNGNGRRLKTSNGGQSSRTNSITTTVTRVTDPNGRTTSITKKTIKRIDGYEYIETTTTTTNLQPLTENEDPTLDPSAQRHFDEFSDNFNMTEEEDQGSLLLLEGGNNGNYQDNLYDSGFIDNHIDDTLNNGNLQELDDNLSIPNEIIEEKDVDIVSEDEQVQFPVDDQYDSQNVDASNEINNSAGFITEEPLFESLLLDDVEEEDEEDIQGNQEDIQNSMEDDNADTLEMINRIEMRDEHVSQKRDVLPSDIVNQQQFAHPYASGLIPLDEASSVSKFSDALDSAPSSNENLNIKIQRSEPTPKQTAKIVKMSATTKPLKKKVTIDRTSIVRDTSRPATKKTVKKSVKAATEPQLQPKKPLTEQEMYLKALEVAKRKVYSASYDSGRPDQYNFGPNDTRSTMGSRMTLRDQSIPKESIVQSHNNNRHIGLGMLQNKESTPQKHNSKRFGSSLFSKNKHESEKPVVVTSPPSQLSTPPVEQTSITSSHQTQPIKPGVSKDISTLNSFKSEQDTKLADEHMYAKALEIAQRRFNDAHQKSLQQQEQEQLQAAKEREEMMRNKIENSIDKYDTTSPGLADGNNSNNNNNTNGNEEQQETVVSTKGQGYTQSVKSSGHRKDGSSDVMDSNVPTKDNMKTAQQLSTNNDANQPGDKDGTEADQEEIINPADQPEGLLTAAPEEPFDSNNITKMPTLDSLTSSKKKHRFPRRPSVDVEKNKSKFRNMLDKVVQFSNENSGYQPSKKEKLKLEEQRRLEEQIDTENAENIYQQQLHPPPLERQRSVSYGASTTLPVQESLNHFPNGLAPTVSVSSFQRQRSGSKHGTMNDAITNSSSIFSHRKKSTVDSLTPPDVQRQQSTSGTPNPDRTMTSINTKQTIEKVNTQSSTKKSKTKFFSKIFKRSKQTS